MMRSRLITYVAIIIVLLTTIGEAKNTLALDIENSINNQSIQKYPQILPGSDLRFEQYTADQGLSMSVVNSIAQDRKGFLWFGTQDGLNRYDGHNFIIFKHDPGNPNSVNANWIQTLLVDTTGLIWIGTENGGLDRYNPDDGTFTHFTNDPKLSESINSNTIYSLYEDRSGVIWVVTSKGLDRLEKGNEKFDHLIDDKKFPNELKDVEFRSIYQDRNGNLWIATKSGLAKRDSSSGEYTLFKHDESNSESISDDFVKVIFEDRAGNIWIGTYGGGLNFLNPDKRTFKHYELGISSENTKTSGSQMIDVIDEDPSGNLWIGTWGGGLHYFDPRTGKSLQFRSEFGDPNSLSSDYINDIFRDRSGSVWIGTFGGGLSKFDISTLFFTHYRKRLNNSNSLINNSVWSVYADSEAIWIGTDGGLTRLDENSGQFKHFTHDPDKPDSLPVNNIYAVFKDHLGNLWAGSANGLSLYDPEIGDFKTYQNDPKDPHSLSSNKISRIFEDRENNLWIATKKGLNQYDPQTGEFKNYFADPNDPQTLIDDAITSVALNKRGNFWIGTYIGLCEFNPTTGYAQRYSIAPADEKDIPDIAVLSIYEDSNGGLWLGTIGRGLINFDPKSGVSKAYHEKDGLPNDTIYGILSDDDGNLWMSTNNGLAEFNPGSDNFTVYRDKDGLQANEFNSDAYFKSSNGRMYFGGINGLSAFFPRDIHQNNYVPSVALISINANGSTPGTGEIPAYIDPAIFRYPDTTFDFEFVSLSYVQPELNQYAYKLENFDHDWNFVGSRNFGRYTNLPGGDYTLHLKASNNDGIWNEEGLSIPIKVIPPFWATIYFRLGIVLFGFLIVFAGYRLRVRSVLNRSRQLESLILERTREIDQRRSELEALYSADEALYRNLQLDQVLQALVESAVSLLQADKGSLLVTDKEKKYLTARVVKGFKPGTAEKLSLAFGEGIAGRVAQSGEPILVQDTQLDDRVTRQVVEEEGIRSIMQVPIKVGGEVFGVFSADFIKPHTFENDELRLLMSLAQRAALAIQNAQIYEQTQEKAITEERNRLARDLHDAVTQTLFSASLIADALPKAFEEDMKEGMELLSELRQLNRGALAEMRALLMELRPIALAESHLEDLLRQLGEAAAGREGIPVTVQTNGRYELPVDVNIALYRIAQEAINNSLKHARADQIAIKLAKYSSFATEASSESEPGIQLTVKDNGRGFDLENIPADHLGLKIMRERAQSIGAQLTIESQEGKGTEVSVLWVNNHL
jgi:ligand-binding sensor domain-containing protein/signal transduction histidine kinase